MVFISTARNLSFKASSSSSLPLVPSIKVATAESPWLSTTTSSELDNTASDKCNAFVNMSYTSFVYISTSLSQSLIPAKSNTNSIDASLTLGSWSMASSSLQGASVISFTNGIGSTFKKGSCVLLAVSSESTERSTASVNSHVIVNSKSAACSSFTS